MRCPYCGSHLVGDPKPVVNEHSAALLKKMGISVPVIRQCKHCTATFSEEAFVEGTARYKRAAAAVGGR